MHPKLISYVVTFVGVFIACNKSGLMGTATFEVNKSRFHIGLFNPARVKRGVHPHEASLQPQDIERTIRPERREATQDVHSTHSQDQSTDRKGRNSQPFFLTTQNPRSGQRRATGENNNINIRDSGSYMRLQANRTSPTIYFGTFQPFTSTTQNPRSGQMRAMDGNNNIDTEQSKGSGSYMRLPANRTSPTIYFGTFQPFTSTTQIPRSEQMRAMGENNNIDTEQSKGSSTYTRLPENRTSPSIYFQSFPPYVPPTTVNPPSETIIDDPPFVKLDESMLDHFDNLLPGLASIDSTDSMQQEKKDVIVIPKNNSTNHSVRIANTTIMSDHVSKYNIAELHDNHTPTNDWHSRWINIRSSTPSSRSETLLIFHGQDDKPADKVNYHLEGIDQNMDIIPAFKRCSIFPMCTLKVSLSSSSNVAKEEYEMLGDALESSFDKYLDNGVKTIEVTCDATNVSVIISVAIVLLVVIIVSNILIIVVTLRTKSLRKPHGYFKISLALADLVNGAFVLPNVCSNLSRYIWFDNRDIIQLEHIRKREPSYPEASFFGTCAVMSQVVTVYSVLLLSVDSFLSVRWPLKYRVGDLMTQKRAAALVISIWVFALAASALPLLAGGYVTYGLSYTTYSYIPIVTPLSQDMSNEEAYMARYIHIILYAVFVWGIPFLCTWVLTILTAYYSRGMLRTMSTVRKSSRNFAITIGRLERDILHTVAVVLTLLTITVMPILVAMLIIFITLDNNSLCVEQYASNMLFAGYYILACGSFVNVIVYNACHKTFRRSTFDFICDIVTFLFGRCCPKYCDMQPFKSNRYRPRNASARATTRTTLDHRKTRNSSHPSTIMSNGFRSSTWQTSIKSPISMRSGVRTPNSVKSCQSACKFNMTHLSATRTFSTDTFTTSARSKCLSSSSALSPQTFRKLTRNQSSSLSDVFLPSPNDAVFPEPPQVKTKSND